jgi:hypothetical protein
LLVAKALVGEAVPDRKGSQNLQQIRVSAILSSNVFGRTAE